MLRVEKTKSNIQVETLSIRGGMGDGRVNVSALGSMMTVDALAWCGPDEFTTLMDGLQIWEDGPGTMEVKMRPCIGVAAMPQPALGPPRWLGQQDFPLAALALNPDDLALAR